MTELIVDRREFNATPRSLFVAGIHLTPNIETVGFETHHGDLVMLRRRLEIFAQQNLN